MKNKNTLPPEPFMPPLTHTYHPLTFAFPSPKLLL